MGDYQFETALDFLSTVTGTSPGKKSFQKVANHRVYRGGGMHYRAEKG
jgi:hypothetical protein